jgi:predicted polyphosphate/ATP-dependent NAD kinase
MAAEQTQLQKANQALVELRAVTTREDRLSVMKELKISRSTVFTYLGGDGTNLDTAIGMVKFFRKRILERTKVLS